MLSESINNVCVCCLDVLIFCLHQMWCGRATVEEQCFDYFLYIEELIDRKQDPKAIEDKYRNADMAAQKHCNLQVHMYKRLQKKS